MKFQLSDNVEQFYFLYFGFNKSVKPSKDVIKVSHTKNSVFVQISIVSLTGMAKSTNGRLGEIVL